MSDTTEPDLPPARPSVIPAKGDPGAMHRAAFQLASKRIAREAEIEANMGRPAASPTAPADPGSSPPVQPVASPAEPRPAPQPPPSPPRVAAAPEQPEEPPQAPEVAEPPASLTGQESDEQLASLGYNSQKSRERFRKLARERNQAMEQTETLRGEVETLRSVLQNLQHHEENQPAPRQVPLQPFNEEFPHDGTLEEQESWGRRKETHELIQQHLYEFAQANARVLAPLMQHRAMTEREAEWQRLDGDLERFGTTREEIEPVVQAIFKNEPTRDLRSVVYDAMGSMGMLAPMENPEPPPVSTPGHGRSAPPTAAPPEADARTQALDELMLAKQAGASGRQAEAQRHMTRYFALMRRADPNFVRRQ